MSTPRSAPPSTPPFGGELAADRFGHTAYLTDSGRSSLRLILQSGFRDKTFLLPDFLCGIIPQVLTELGVRFGFYHVGENFEIEARSVAAQNFDVLYVIDFFGRPCDYQDLADGNQWVVEDCVFLPAVAQRGAYPNWIGFNSLRKASALADGSVTVSRTPLDRSLIGSAEAPFVGAKYAAKRLKYRFLSAGEGSEDGYIALFGQAEQMIDAQQEIYSMSAESTARYLEMLVGMDTEMSRRRENMEILRHRLGHLEVRPDVLHPSHFVIAVAERDALRKQLREQHVFLPSHWPHTHGPRNALYDDVIAISVDARYGAGEIARVADAVHRCAPNPRPSR
jgi:hypothetical protein